MRQAANPLNLTASALTPSAQRSWRRPRSAVSGRTSWSRSSPAPRAGWGTC